MKLYSLAIVLVFALISCEKDPEPTCSDGELNQNEVYADCGGPCNPCPISYPENGNLGTNLLYGMDTLFLLPSNYSLRADVPTGSSLKIYITSVSGDMWLYGTNNGWEISTPTSSQWFEVVNAGTADVVFNLTNGTGTAIFEYFENSSAVTKSKVIVWG